MVMLLYYQRLPRNLVERTSPFGGDMYDVLHPDPQFFRDKDAGFHGKGHIFLDRFNVTFIQKWILMDVYAYAMPQAVKEFLLQACIYNDLTSDLVYFLGSVLAGNQRLHTRTLRVHDQFVDFQHSLGGLPDINGATKVGDVPIQDHAEIKGQRFRQACIKLAEA